MDSVLDTLLNCIHDLVPFEKAAVLFAEGGAALMVARKAPRSVPPGTGTTLPATICPHLQQIPLNESLSRRQIFPKRWIRRP
jgi:hypothetical protein